MKCTNCGIGHYAETSIHDDLYGEKHCTECGHGIQTRYKRKHMKCSRCNGEGKHRDFHPFNLEKIKCLLCEGTGEMQKYPEVLVIGQFEYRYNADEDIFEERVPNSNHWIFYSSPDLMRGKMNRIAKFLNLQHETLFNKNNT